MTLRRSSNMDWEANLAMLSLAGLRLLVQAAITPVVGDNIYTVTDIRTRRVVIFVNDATTIVTINMDAAATATHLPVKNQVYFVVDAKKDQVIHLNASAAVANVIRVVEVA